MFSIAASVFFLTYDTTKYLLNGRLDRKYDALIHVIGASIGEVVGFC